MKGWTIRHRVLAGFGLLLLLMVVTGLFAYDRLSQIHVRTEAVDRDSIDGLYFNAQLGSAWADARGSLRTYLLALDTERQRPALQDLQGQRQRLQDAVRRYAPTVFTEAGRQAYAKVQAASERFHQLAGELVQLGEARRRAEAQALFERDFAPLMETMKSVLDAQLDIDREHAVESMQAIRSDVTATNRGMLAAIGLAAVTAVVLGLLLLRSVSHPLQRVISVLDTIRQGDFTQRLQIDRRDEMGALASGYNRMIAELVGLVGQVQKSGIQVNTSVTQIAATARQQQATASEVAATTTQISATSKEISATSRELQRTVGEVSGVADQAAALASSGQSSLSQMEQTMKAVMEASSSINAKLTVLNERAANIGQVVITITKVADQTNLLSLNAAIEAEKAGEFGRGFSVVATEIRRLADQTAVASYDIEQMVREIQSAVSASVMGMDKFTEEVRRGMQEMQRVSDQLAEIIQHVQALAPRFEAVNEGMRAQADGAEQISQALVQLNEASRQTVESLQQSNAAIDNLNGVASGLLDGVSRFQLQQA
jgi:methyl-accepting chemotaxis protein WspA